MNRRRFLMALMGLAASGALPACSGFPGLAPATESVSLRSVIMPGVLPMTRGRELRRTFEAWADEAHTAHPSLTVTTEELDYEDLMGENGDFALDMLFGEDTEYDCLLAQSIMLSQMLEKKLLAPLDSFLQGSSTVKRDDYLPALIAPMESEGQLWGLPATFNPLVIRYNRTLFGQLGVPEPPKDWTWDQFLETTALLKAGMSDSQFALAAGPSNLVVFLYVLGGSIYDSYTAPKLLHLDDPATTDAFAQLASLMEQGVVPDADRVEAYEKTADEGGARSSVAVSMVGDGGEAAMADVQAMADYSMRLSIAAANGDVGMWFSPLEEGQMMNLGMVAVQMGQSSDPNETGIALLPRRERMVTLADTTMYSLVAASKAQKEAWTWIELLAGKLPPMGLPPRRSLLLAPESASQMSAEAAAVAQALAQDLDGLDIMPSAAIASAAPVALAIWRAWMGKDASEALAEATETMQDNLDEAAAGGQ